MKYKILIVSILSINLLTGCITTTEKALQYAHNNYNGQSLDKLVLNIGPPRSKYTMDNGNILYKWVYSGTMSLPSTTFYNNSATINTYGRNTAIQGAGSATTFGGGVSQRICDMSVLTTKNNIIKGIKFNRDTFGTEGGTASMCAQMFRIN